MKQWIGVYLLLNGKRFLGRRGFLLSILILPCLIMGIGKMSATQSEQWRVGLYSEEEGLAEETIKALCQQHHFLQFYQCNSLEELQEDVERKYAECGFFFSAGFEESFYQEMEETKVVIFYAPSSVATKMAREEVFATVLGCANENILTNFVTEELGACAEEELKELYQKYAVSGNIFRVHYSELENDEDRVNSQIILSPVRGLVALFIWVEIVFVAFVWYKDDRQGITKCMKQQQRAVFKATTFLVPVILSWAAAYIVMTTLGMLVRPWYEEAILLCGYAVICMFFTLNLYELCENATTYVCAVTVCLTASVVICPIFISIATFFPQYDWLQYILVPGAYLSKIMTGESSFFIGQLIFYLLLYFGQRGAKCLTSGIIFDRM